jgi:uncharacterized protein (TIGR03435 family)
MVRSLLDDRFKLTAHREQREMPFLALVRAKPGRPLGPSLLRMEECSSAIVNELRRTFPDKYPTPMGAMMSGCSRAGLDSLATSLSLKLGVSIIDETGLSGSFYHTIRSEQLRMRPAVGADNDPGLPSLSTALEEQLGLKLESRRGPMDMLVIDSVQRPTEN